MHIPIPLYGLTVSTFVSFAPIREAMTTRVVEMKIIIIPRAESLPHKPSSANRRICTARTSVPGLESTTGISFSLPEAQGYAMILPVRS